MYIFIVNWEDYLFNVHNMMPSCGFSEFAVFRLCANGNNFLITEKEEFKGRRLTPWGGYGATVHIAPFFDFPAKIVHNKSMCELCSPRRRVFKSLFIGQWCNKQ